MVDFLPSKYVGPYLGKELKFAKDVFFAKHTKGLFFFWRPSLKTFSLYFFQDLKTFKKINNFTSKPPISLSAYLQTVSPVKSSYAHKSTFYVVHILYSPFTKAALPPFLSWFSLGTLLPSH